MSLRSPLEREEEVRHCVPEHSEPPSEAATESQFARAGPGLDKQDPQYLPGITALGQSEDWELWLFLFRVVWPFLFFFSPKNLFIYLFI